MGHLIFLLIHFVALLSFPMLLFLTVPLHLIYAATSHRRPDPGTPNPRTHIRCPDCKEFVQNEAIVCKHCGAKLVPLSQQPKSATPIRDFFNRPLR